MRWLNRSLLLCLVILVVTPRPAHAWFEWLDRLSGPGRWLGAKIDVRAFCFGERMPVPEVREAIAEVTRGMVGLNPRDSEAVTRIQNSWNAIFKQIEAMREQLNIALDSDPSPRVSKLFESLKISNAERVSEADIRSLEDPALERLNSIHKVLAAIASGGIFVSLCPADRERSFGVEFGSTWLWTGGNEKFAGNESIALKTFTLGLSYRIPRPATSDFFDIGTNVGVASFSSKGFNAFDTLLVEPFVDAHLATSARLSKSKATRILSRFTLRTSLIFFPQGFEAGDFGPSTPRISGSEANLSFTVYYNVRFPRAFVPSPRPGA